MVAKLEKIKLCADEQHSSHFKVKQKDDEVSALQKTIGELQLCLFQEREQV